MLTDFHTHIFPDKIADKTIKLLESNIKEEYRPHKAELRGTLDALKQSMRENNVDISLVLPIATNVKQSTTINNFAASINGIDGIYSLGSLHPMQSDWESVLYDIKEKGLKGIKLHPEYQQFYIDSKESMYSGSGDIQGNIHLINNGKVNTPHGENSGTHKNHQHDQKYQHTGLRGKKGNPAQCYDNHDKAEGHHLSGRAHLCCQESTAGAAQKLKHIVSDDCD